MLLCARASCRIRSPGPNRWPIVVSLVEWPPTNTMASCVPMKSAMARSNSRWTGFSPETSRLAETLVPKRSMAALAARATVGSPDMPR